MPSKTDINSVVKNLKNFSYLPELQEAKVVEGDIKGFLFCLSGGFNLVYKYVTAQQKTKALRINFTGNFDAVFLRIAKIEAYLKNKDLPYFVDFTYHEKALSINRQNLPAITMEWREGLLLKDYIKAHLNQPQKIAALAEEFKTMIECLHTHQIAHGDLQHGNILVHQDGKLSLLDYDSVIIPEFVDSDETITGLRTYQHPQRFLKSSNNSHLKIDFFSELIIYMSLLVLSKKPQLFNSMALDKSEGLLFTENDFKDIRKAAVAKEIVSIAGCESYMIILAYYLSLENLHDLVYFVDLLNWLDVAKGRERFYGFYGNYYFEKMQAVQVEEPIFKTEAENLNWWQQQKLKREGKNKMLSEAIENKPQARKSFETFNVKGYSFDMIYVEGGSFMMGATAEQGDDAYDKEEPVHEVCLDSFYMGKYVVTQGLWVAVMGSNPSYFKGDLQRPVESVSWNDCQEFISKLNALTGKNFRLPTEAEWEYAARGGVSTGSTTIQTKYACISKMIRLLRVAGNAQQTKYAGSNDLDAVGWYDGNNGDKTHTVGLKKPNALGIFDMSGNVWEWCGDWYGAYSSRSQTNPTGPSSGSYRVIRGGSWFIHSCFCRVSYRNYYFPSTRIYNGGFRLSL